MNHPSLAGLLLLLLPVSGQGQISEKDSKPVASNVIRLNYAVFDPIEGVPAVPLPSLRSRAGERLWIVQFEGLQTWEDRERIRSMGGEPAWFLPDNAYLVRMDRAVAERVERLERVRWVGRYEPAYRLEGALLSRISGGEALPRARYNVVLVDPGRDKAALGRRIGGIGGRVVHEQPGAVLMEVVLPGDRLVEVCHMDQVLWIDRWTPPGEDMDNARIQGGGNYVERVGKYTGKGINGHVYEGVEANHPDFNQPAVNVWSGGAAESHGHCTAGIVFGNGTSNPRARGMAPDAKIFYTNYHSVLPGKSRWQVVRELVTNRKVMFTTASWGNARTTRYNSVSAETDNIIFCHDIPWTQCQSNAGNRMSRPQAWAKNVFGVGAVMHFENDDRRDDSWGAGGASIGPASDGRIKPDFCAYFDSICCSDRTGPAGYSNGSFFEGFRGTSGATAIVAGHNALALQMFTDFIFRNKPKVPGGSRFQNRPISPP